MLLLGPESIDVPDYDYAKVGLEVRSYQVTDEITVRVPSGHGAEWAGKVVVKGGDAKGHGVEIASVADMQERDGL